MNMDFKLPWQVGVFQGPHSYGGTNFTFFFRTRESADVLYERLLGEMKKYRDRANDREPMIEIVDDLGIKVSLIVENYASFSVIAREQREAISADNNIAVKRDRDYAKRLGLPMPDDALRIEDRGTA